MELTTLLGIIVGFAAVVGAMVFKGISFSVFLNPAAFCVIIVGTIATILNSYPGKNLKNIGALFKILLTKQKGNDEVEIYNLMVDLAITARKDGLLALDKKVQDIEDPFVKKGISMITLGLAGDVIEEILETEIEAMEKRHEINASIFSSAGMFAPTLGVLGAVFGLIAAMGHIDDTDLMAEAIAAAFIATVLGIFTGYVLWTPFAKKLKVKSQEEVILKNMILIGLLSIQKGDSPAVLKERLLAVLPPPKQKKILEEAEME